MTTTYTSQQPIDDFGLLFSDLKYSASLAASTNTTFTVPCNYPKYKALIKVENNGLVWVGTGSDAAEAPGGATFALTTCELVNDNSTLCRHVQAGQVLNFFTETADTDVSIVLYVAI